MRPACAAGAAGRRDWGCGPSRIGKKCLAGLLQAAVSAQSPWVRPSRLPIGGQACLFSGSFSMQALWHGLAWKSNPKQDSPQLPGCPVGCSKIRMGREVACLSADRGSGSSVQRFGAHSFRTEPPQTLQITGLKSCEGISLNLTLARRESRKEENFHDRDNPTCGRWQIEMFL